MKKTDKNLAALTAIFVTSIVTANVVGARTITSGLSLGPIQLAASGAFVTYAVSFLCTDIIGEIWGKEEAKRAVWYGFLGQMFAAACIWLTGLLPASDPAMDSAYHTLLGQNWVFVLGSMAAYWVSQSWDVLVFHSIRERYIKRRGSAKGGRWLWNNASTLTSQALDSAIYIFICFGLGLGWVFTPQGRAQLLGILVGQYLLKAGMALLDTPFFYFFTRKAE